MATGGKAVRFDLALITAGNTRVMSVPDADGTIALAVSPAGTAFPATTGTVTITMDSQIKALTPTDDMTLNATGGLQGQTLALIVTTAGATSYTLTFGTGFKTAGTLATGVTAAKVFVISFVYSGTAWVEVSRTAAL